MERYGGTVVFESDDLYGPVEVIDSGNIRSLHFGTAVSQSSMFLDDPFRLEMEYNRVMMAGLLFEPQPKRVLFLGLGGGAKPKFIWKFFPQSLVEVVELSPLVIETCHKYFSLPHDPRLIIQNQDALAFLKLSHPEKFDMIFIDLYVGSGISPVVADLHFFEYCKKLMTPKGLLLWNMWTSSKKETIDMTLGHLGMTFGNHFLVMPNQESSNYVILTFNEENPKYSLRQLIKTGNLLKESTNLDFPQLIKNLNHFVGLSSAPIIDI